MLLCVLQQALARHTALERELVHEEVVRKPGKAVFPLARRACAAVPYTSVYACIKSRRSCCMAAESHRQMKTKAGASGAREGSPCENGGQAAGEAADGTAACGAR